MSQSCPNCKKDITAPSLVSYEEHFVCPHCASKLSPSENDIFLYSLGFIALVTFVLVITLQLNTFIAIGISAISYRLLRPRLFEPYFRIQHYKSQ